MNSSGSSTLEIAVPGSAIAARSSNTKTCDHREIENAQRHQQIDSETHTSAATEHADIRADSPETDPDMPLLVRLEHSQTWTAAEKESRDLEKQTMWRIDGIVYRLPLRVRTYIESACNRDIEGLSHLAEAASWSSSCSDSDFRWFQQYLGIRHGLYIAGFFEDINTGKKTARISECTQRKQKSWVGSREPTYARDLPTQRKCRFDGKLWTLSQTLDFALNECGASYNWTIGFWERDFVY